MARCDAALHFGGGGRPEFRQQEGQRSASTIRWRASTRRKTRRVRSAIETAANPLNRLVRHDDLRLLQTAEGSYVVGSAEKSRSLLGVDGPTLPLPFKPSTLAADVRTRSAAR